MPSKKELKNRINSVQDTMKITNAMYLIATTKMRKAKNELDHTKPYFDALRSEIKQIFQAFPDVDSPFFIQGNPQNETNDPYGYLIITADKGLAGAYNQSVIKAANRLTALHDNNRLFVIGEYGRHYYNAHQIPIVESFSYTAQNPTLHRAREISALLFDQYRSGKLKKIFIIYTDFKNGLNTEVKTIRVLPFRRTDFISNTQNQKYKNNFEYVPTASDILDRIIPNYLVGFIYSVLVYSFCSEQNARMTAMDNASHNAQKLLDALAIEFNHVRQGAITQEITEIAASAQGLHANPSIDIKEVPYD